jgi:hypothetical protein
MNRILLAITALSVCLSVPLFGEAYGTWNTKNILEEKAKLCDRVEKEAIERAERLTKESAAYTVQFQYPEKKGAQKSFALRWKHKQFTQEDVSGRWKDLMRITAELSIKEAEARPLWLEKMKDRINAERAEKEGAIYGTKIKARRLGAILDNSPSMAKYLPALRKEIKHTFEDYPSVEIWGSFLTSNTTWDPDLKKNVDQDTRWSTMVPGDGEDPFDPAWHLPPNLPKEEALHFYSIHSSRDNVSAILGMVELHKTDALYWFCDLKDDIADSAVKRIAEVILKNKVALYVHTVGRKPKGLLDLLVTKSGGAVLTERPRIIPPERPPVNSP